MDDKPIVNGVESERCPDLAAQIDRVYAEVFSNSDAFRRFFFATPDTTARDAQVRLGIYLKRLVDNANDRMWQVRRHYPATVFPEMSLHNLGYVNGTNWIAINGYLQTQLDAWEKEQPDTLEKFAQLLKTLLQEKFNLPMSDSEGDFDIVYLDNKLVLSEDMIIEVLESIWNPESLNIKRITWRNNRELEVSTPQFTCTIGVQTNPDLGDYIHVYFHKDSIIVEDTLRLEYENYYNSEIVPLLLENTLRALDPEVISHTIKKKREQGIVERFYILPGKFKSSRQPLGLTDHFAYGRTADLINHYAVLLGLVPKELRHEEYPSVNGWVQTVEELWHLVFNTQFEGNALNIEPNNDQSIVIRDNTMTQTYSRIIEHNQRDASDLKDILMLAEKVIGKYRTFRSFDKQYYRFPEEYTPIAVDQTGEFAIGYKQADQGLEICFQVNSRDIVAQVNGQVASNEAQIRILEERNLQLSSLAEQYPIDES